MPLTPTQSLAIDPTSHTLVEAGAGAGKTAVLVARYLAILAHYPSLTPAHILTLTFTKHAAGEFERRITHALHELIHTDPTQKSLATTWLRQLPHAQLKTIHSFCHEIMKKWGHQIGIDPGFQIITQEKAHWRQISDHWLDTHQDHPSLMAWATQAPIGTLRPLLTQWAHSHRANPSPHHRHHGLLTHAMTLFDAIWSHYQTVCHQTHQMGFSALQTHALTLVSNPHIAQSIANQYPHLLMDECQDTDPVQWEIIDRITHFSSTPRSCLFVVGDIKQSIYGFRGAKPHIFDTIKSLMTRPHIKGQIVTLTDNFRSNHPLIDYFNGLFPRLFDAPSPLTPDLPISYTPLQSQRGHVGGVYHLHSDSGHDEGRRIAEYLQTLDNPTDTVILARSKRILDDGYAALSQAGIPATLAGQSDQLSNQDIIDVLHLGLLLEHPHDRTWWTYFLRSPWVNADIEMVSSIVNSPGFPTTFLSGNHPIASTLRTWLAHKDTHGLVAALRQACALLPPSGDDHARSMACDQILDWMAQWPPLTNATEQLESVFEEGISIPMPVPPHTVRLMTIHAAKGLEFKRVILAGMGRECIGRKPGVRSLITESEVAIRLPGDTDHEAYDQLAHTIDLKQLEEEKRIFYVACTRASEELIFSSHGPLPESGQAFHRKTRYIDMAAVIPLPPPIDIRPIPSPPPISKTTMTEVPPTILSRPIIASQGYRRWSVHDVMAWLDSPRECQLGRHVRWDVPDPRHAQVGAAVHFWLFKQCQGHPMPARWWNELPNTIREDVKAHVSRCQAWLPSLQGGDGHHPEWPFQLVIGHTIISGRADLVRQIGNQWEVIDFKTGDPSLPRVQHQLMLYALAIQKAVTPIEWPIRAKVMSSKTGRCTEWMIEREALALFEQTITNGLTKSK